jgi:transcriptional regulator with XRE-family HTH domain
MATPDPSTALQERIRRARELAQLSRTDLSELAGLARGHVALLEAGKRPNLGVFTIAPIARVLGVSLDWLIAGKGEPPPASTIQAAVKRARSRRITGG